MLESKRLYFLQWEQGDFEELKKTLGNPKVCEYLPGDNSRTDTQIKKSLTFFSESFNDTKGNKVYKIVEKNTGEVIGYGGLCYVSEYDKIEIMYGFSQKYWGLGYATESSLRFKQLAKELNLKQVIALCDIANSPSHKVLLKTGFKKQNEVDLWGLHLNYYEMNL